MSADTTRPSFLDRQRDAALADYLAEAEDNRRVADIVSGAHRPGRPRTECASNVIKLADGDYLVEITDRSTDKKKWATVVGNKSDSWRWYTQGEAMLYLITRRQQPRGDESAVTYAARVLGMPLTD